MTNTSLHKRVLFLILMLAMVQLACSLSSFLPSALAQPPADETQPPASAAQPQTGESQPQTSSQPVLSGDPTTIVVQVIKTLPTVSYRKREWFAVDQGSSPDLNQPPSLVAEFTPPNNSHVTIADSEYLTVNGNFYSRKTGGQWELSVPDAVSQDTSAQVAEMFSQALQNGELTIQAAGSDAVNGAPASVFDISGQVTVVGTSVSISGKVWIGNDGRLLKSLELRLPRLWWEGLIPPGERRVSSLWRR